MNRIRDWLDYQPVIYTVLFTVIEAAAVNLVGALGAWAFWELALRQLFPALPAFSCSAC